MITKLYKGLNKDDIAELRANFIQAQRLRKRLRQLLDDEISSVYYDMEKDDNYQLPSWGAHQAGRLEKVKTLKMLKKWLEDEKS